jgi:hypothetical protein
MPSTIFAREATRASRFSVTSLIALDSPATRRRHVNDWPEFTLRTERGEEFTWSR